MHQSRSKLLASVFAGAISLGVAPVFADDTPDLQSGIMNDDSQHIGGVHFHEAASPIIPAVLKVEDLMTYGVLKADSHGAIQELLDDLFGSKDFGSIFPDGEPSDDTIIHIAPYSTTYLIGNITDPERSCILYPDGVMPSNGLQFSDVDTTKEGTIIILHTGQDESGYYSTTLFYDGRHGKLECSLFSSQQRSDDESPSYDDDGLTETRLKADIAAPRP